VNDALFYILSFHISGEFHRHMWKGIGQPKILGFSLPPSLSSLLTSLIVV